MCLYFIPGSTYKTVDFEFMKEISNICNLIPVVSKGDSINQEEAIQIKANIFETSINYKIEFLDLNEAINVFYYFKFRKYVMIKNQQTVFLEVNLDFALHLL